MSADGRTVVFASHANDLVPGDFNNTRDVFVLTLGGADNDADGMDDEWELTYFDTLDRDGAGDFDGDGMTDGDEFRAGTDPTNAGSVFRVFRLTPLPGGQVTLFWNAIPGRTYQAQARTNAAAGGWVSLGNPSIATNVSASISLATGGQTNQFYRVALVP